MPNFRQQQVIRVAITVAGSLVDEQVRASVGSAGFEAKPDLREISAAEGLRYLVSAEAVDTQCYLLAEVSTFSQPITW